MMVFYPLMLILLLVSVAGQQLLDPLTLRVTGQSVSVWLILPWTFFYSLALAVPYPLMLLFAFVTGFIWDTLYQVPVDQPDLAFGSSVALFALLGSFMQGVRPLFRRGNWFFPVFMVGLLVFVQLSVEYLLISLSRSSFDFSSQVWFEVLFSSMAAVLMAPLFLMVISRVAQETGYQLKYEQFTFRKSYGHQI